MYLALQRIIQASAILEGIEIFYGSMLSIFGPG